MRHYGGYVEAPSVLLHEATDRGRRNAPTTPQAVLKAPCLFLGTLMDFKCAL